MKSSMTIGAIVRQDHLRQHPFGFKELSGFGMMVRCSRRCSGRGDDEAVRMFIEFVADSKLESVSKIAPEYIIAWWEFDVLEQFLRTYMQRTRPDLGRPFNIVIDGNGKVISQPSHPES